eukprot:TRINITY_DN67525_c5_g1_i1.p1 TRINITY_DN67525_c5_g1~~TRINITY_DN67525_c5_g1_i1.p1  ORF type:complete len:250 (+),score=20.42 TRINITY_DN67525_c5_g1_i1:38-787(+)
MSAGYHHFLQVTHPTSLHCVVSLTGGKKDTEGNQAPNVLSFWNSKNAACGCGGTFTFTKTVDALESSYRCRRTFTSGLGVRVEQGAEVRVNAEGPQAAVTGRVSAHYGIRNEEVEEYFERRNHRVEDTNLVSVATIYHCYGNYDWLQFEWVRNDLNLEPKDPTLLFAYGGTTYLKIHPDFRLRDYGPPTYADANNGNQLFGDTVLDARSPLRFTHDPYHRAFLVITIPDVEVITPNNGNNDDGTQEMET